MSCGGARSPTRRGSTSASSPMSDWSSSATACSGSRSPRSSIAVRPDVDEGRLAQQRAYVVSRSSCALVARTLDLEDEFERERERRGAETRIEPSRNVLAALCESVIGAAFLQFGYRETADAVVEAFHERIDYAEQGFVDHKTELQERLARQGASVSYRLMEATGPAHRRSFTTAAVLGDDDHRHGRGPVEEGLRAGCRPGGAAARGRARAGCAPERHPPARLQVVPRAARAALRARGLGRRRARTARASPTSPTRCSGRWPRSRPARCAPRRGRTCSSRAPSSTRRAASARSSSCSTTATAASASRAASSR